MFDLRSLIHKLVYDCIGASVSFLMGDVSIIHKQYNMIQVFSIFEYSPMHSLIDIIPARCQIRLCHVWDEVNKVSSDVVTKRFKLGEDIPRSQC